MLLKLNDTGMLNIIYGFVLFTLVIPTLLSCNLGE